MKPDYLIVGAGLTGATIARILTDAGKRCLVIDKRDHIAGNCYDEMWGGIRVNLYGGHIFHTNSLRVWNFAQRYSDWTPYEHRVKAHYRGRTFSLPPNKLTFEQLNLNGDAQHAQDVLMATFFAGYSFKQWGKHLADVPQSVIKRIPIRHDYDDRYFTDKYQALPSEGYTAWVANMLADIPVETNTEYDPTMREMGDRIIYTGPLDALYGYRFGRLEYRSLRFEHERLPGDFQGCATMNYTDYTPAYTRIMEWKHFGYQRHTETQITREYPQIYNGVNEPYYPVNDDANNALYRRYAEMAIEDGLTVGGRLGQFRYYNMDQAIAAGMKIAEGLLNA